MKSKLFLYLFLFVVSSSFSQNSLQLLSTTKQFYSANFLMDFDTLVSFSYPKMVETIGKEILLDKLDKFYENEEYRLRYQLESVPFQMSSRKIINGKSFCVITCRNPLRYFFEKKLTLQEAEIKATWLKETNQTKEVTFEPKRNSFNVRKTTTYIAVMDETTAGTWKFFNLDDASQKQVFENLFDETIKAALGLSK